MSTFEQFGLPPSIHRALESLKFINPTPIQVKAIPPGLAGRDVLGMAQTGTGKTGAFAIPLCVRLMNDPKASALVLAPTRELAMQIHEFMKALAGKNFNLSPALIIGGMSMRQQNHQLRSGSRILIATPGRLVDHLRTQPQLLSKSSIFVLDEADRMLDMGFAPQLKIVIRHLPRVRQTLLFSATFPPEIKRMVNELLHNPVEASVGQTSVPIAKIEQTVIRTTQKEKNEILLDELNARQGSVLIFTRTKHRTDRLSKYLNGYGYMVTRIHGDRTQGQRKMAIEGFRSGQYRILVATDIAARGLDIDDIAHVINYDLPQVPEDFVHRIGRTARNGKSGQALSMITPEDKVMWRSIARVAKFDPEERVGEKTGGPQGPRAPHVRPAFKPQGAKAPFTGRTAPRPSSHRR